MAVASLFGEGATTSPPRAMDANDDWPFLVDHRDARACEAAYEAVLLRYLASHGKTNLALLGVRCKKPPEVTMRYSQFLQARSALFRLTGDWVELTYEASVRPQMEATPNRTCVASSGSKPLSLLDCPAISMLPYRCGSLHMLWPQGWWFAPSVSEPRSQPNAGHGAR